MTLDPNLNVAAQDVIFACATLWGKLPGGAQYDVPFASLQDAKIVAKATLKELQDPQYLTPIAVGTEKREWTFTAKWGKVRSRALQACLGGGAPTTSLVAGQTMTTNSFGGLTDLGPMPFQAQLKSGAATNAPVMGVIYAGICEQLTLDMKLRDYIMPEFQCKLFTDPVSGKVIDIVTFGDQTSDTVGAVPSAPVISSVTGGAASSGQMTTAWTASTSGSPTSYSVYRGLASTGPFIWVGDTIDTRFVDVGVSGTTYFYVVAGNNANGQSAYSAVLGTGFVAP